MPAVAGGFSPSPLFFCFSFSSKRLSSGVSFQTNWIVKSQRGTVTVSGAPDTVTVPRCDFTIQFVWKETPLDKRLEEKEKQKKSGEGEKPPATAGIPPVGQIR